MMDDKTKTTLCQICHKNKATIDYANGWMEFTHGFTKKICSDCYDNITKNSNWYKQGFTDGKKSIQKAEHPDCCKKEPDKILKTYIRDEVKQARIEAIEEFSEKLNKEFHIGVDYDESEIGKHVDKIRQEMLKK